MENILVVKCKKEGNIHSYSCRIGRYVTNSALFLRSKVATFIKPIENIGIVKVWPNFLWSLVHILFSDSFYCIYHILSLFLLFLIIESAGLTLTKEVEVTIEKGQYLKVNTVVNFEKNVLMRQTISTAKSLFSWSQKSYFPFNMLIFNIVCL